MEEVTKLRKILANDPNKPKALARLSFLLVEQIKEIQNEKQKEMTFQEAYEVAKRSIELAPDKPLGHAALSVSSPNFKERMSALEKAVQLDKAKEEEKGQTQSHNAGSMVARASSLVRLLVDPRDEEKRDRTGGNNHSKRIARRDLNSKEEQLYMDVKLSLEKAHQLVISQKNDTNEERKRCYLCMGKGHYRLGKLFRKLHPEEKHKKKAIFHFNSAIHILPKDDAMIEQSKFWLATMDTNQSSIDVGRVNRCPEEYIISLYSTFADKFDDLLVNKLQYQTPTKLRKLVDQSRSPKEQNNFENCLDLGCGTGLSGLAFRDCANSLVGVDLSPEMIERARQRNCYKQLLVGDLESAFHAKSNWNPPGSFDLVVACDVFVYIGDLDSIFLHVRQNLSLNGMFAFSTEALDEDECSDYPFILHKNARFAHKKSYVENLAREMKFTVNSMIKTVIRRNQGKDVQGFLVILRPVKDK